MVRVIFKLSMPGVSSWNGKWSGADNNYSVARQLSSDTAARVLAARSHHHNFGDGWRARVDAHLAATREKVSGQFCGYEWMIDDFIKASKAPATADPAQEAQKNG